MLGCDQAKDQILSRDQAKRLDFIFKLVKGYKFLGLGYCPKLNLKQIEELWFQAGFLYQKVPLLLVSQYHKIGDITLCIFRGFPNSNELQSAHILLLQGAKGLYNSLFSLSLYFVQCMLQKGFALGLFPFVLVLPQGEVAADVRQALKWCCQATWRIYRTFQKIQDRYDSQIVGA